MRIASINTVPYGSTGRIMLQITDLARARGHEAITFSKTRLKNPYRAGGHYYIGTRLSNAIHRYIGPLTGRDGGYSRTATRRLIRHLDKFKPDLIHLHNLHGWYLNYELLFAYIKKRDIPVVWTLHDCWAFTGHCPHFLHSGCEKWKTECHHCPQLAVYPESRVESTGRSYREKREAFTGVKSMTLVTPSRWLADMVGESFLGGYPTRLINNGIDLAVFKPTPSDIRDRLGIGGRRLILGVSSDWGERKGLDVFATLASRLGDGYAVLLVGVDEKTARTLPAGIITLPRTESAAELAAIYTAADLFVNPTREDNYPTVNMEALACGTPVITFAAGGSAEIIDEATGTSVPVDDIDALEREIRRITGEHPFDADACVARARGFDKNARFAEYLDLYETITK